jgi:phage terminase large subunit
LRKSGKSNLENLNDLRIRALWNVPHNFAASAGVITFANGSRIIAGHFQAEKDIDKYLGLEYDVIGVEEATTLISQKWRHISTRNRTSKIGWRPRMYSTTNPGGVGHAWYRSKFILPLRAKCETTTRFIQALPRDNPWLDREYVARLERTLVGWERRAWLEGDWDIAAGQYFTNFRLDVHRVSDANFDEGQIVEWFAAMDYGFTHYTVILLAGVDRDGRIFVVDEHAERKKLPEFHAEAFQAMLARHKLNLRSLARLSAGTDIFAKESDGNTIAKRYADLGINFGYADTDRVNGWSEILSALGDPEKGIPARLFIHARCARTLETIPLLQHDPHKPEDVLKVDVDDDGIGGDDAGDCLRYLVATKTRKVVARKLSGV